MADKIAERRRLVRKKTGARTSSARTQRGGCAPTPRRTAPFSAPRRGAIETLGLLRHRNPCGYMRAVWGAAGKFGRIEPRARLIACVNGVSSMRRSYRGYSWRRRTKRRAKWIAIAPNSPRYIWGGGGPAYPSRPDLKSVRPICGKNRQPGKRLRTSWRVGRGRSDIPTGVTRATRWCMEHAASLA